MLAAAVILPGNIRTSWLKQIRDSKQLSLAKREFLFFHIQQKAIAIGIGLAGRELIDARGIIEATQLAMKLAIDQLSPPAETILIDYMHLPEVELPQKGLVKGDSRCFSIACASIIAKVTRDRLMTELDRVYPGYELAHHKGYGTRGHLDCLRKLGPSSIHRQSFKPVKDMM